MWKEFIWEQFFKRFTKLFWSALAIHADLNEIKCVPCRNYSCGIFLGAVYLKGDQH